MNGQSRGTDNIWVHNKQDAEKQHKKRSIIWVGHHHAHIYMADHFSGFAHVL